MLTLKMIFAGWVFTLVNAAFTAEVAEQVSRTGSFELPCSSDTAFPLFSPEGERAWVQGWNPKPIFPEKIEFVRDTVFREGKVGQEAVWTIIEADSKQHRAEYVRVASGSHAAHIVVKIESLDSGHCKVAVKYTVTAFGKDKYSETLLAAFSEEAYVARMHDWQQLTTAYLERRKL